MLNVVFESTPLAISPFCSTLKTHGKVWLSCEKIQTCNNVFSCLWWLNEEKATESWLRIYTLGAGGEQKCLAPLAICEPSRKKPGPESFWKELWSRGQIGGSKLPTEKDSAWVGPLKVRGWQGELQIASYIMEACPGNCREKMGEVLTNHSKIK